jgi:hypothetical protein
MIGFAAMPGMEVDPMWWMPPASHGASACSSRSRSYSKRRGHSGSYGTTTVIERLQFDLNVSHGRCGIRGPPGPFS